MIEYQPLQDLIGVENIEELKNAPNSESIRKCYTKLMHSTQESISKTIAELSTTFKNSDSNNKLLAEVFAHCNHYFPNDIGVLSIFFLNIVQMKPGEAIFLAANEPHAYLSGDCVECMACSDNVIRAGIKNFDFFFDIYLIYIFIFFLGLTPKFKDLETLLEMLDYSGKTVEEKFFRPVDIGPYSKLFQPPVKDFAVIKVDIPSNVSAYAIENRSFGSILIVLKGNASASFKGQQLFELIEGSIVFLPSCIKSLGLTINDTDAGFIAYQALYNDF